MTVRLYSDKVINRIVSRDPGVRSAVKRNAEQIGTRAEAALAAIADTGDSKIVVTHGRTDSYVSLDDSRGDYAALSIEYGHTAPNGRWVDGAYVLHRAAGLV
ncbi:DUF5403 family protein [Pseudonocardia sp. 73-21]|uniref:DUF5403 family protein n=1 Tax=Pseudonocardia sp. 73-21 TaxID=1895809 RepID=UPI00268E32EE